MQEQSNLSLGNGEGNAIFVSLSSLCAMSKTVLFIINDSLQCQKLSKGLLV